MAYGIFRKMGVVESDRQIRRLIQSYIDQRTKVAGISVEQAQLLAPSDAEYRALVVAKKAPLRPGTDFTPSAHPSPPVRVMGFLNTEIAHLRPDGSKPDLTTDLSLLSEFWCKRTSKVQAKAYHTVFSLDPAMQEMLHKAKIPVSDILLSAAMGALGDYAAWLYPDQALGALLGFHSDKPNTHIHGLIFPYTNKGTHLNMSANSPFSYAGKSLRVDCQGYLHRSYVNNLEMVERPMLSGIAAAQTPGGDAFAQSVLRANIHTRLAREAIAKQKDLGFGKALALTAELAATTFKDPAARAHSHASLVGEMKELGKVLAAKRGAVPVIAKLHTEMAEHFSASVTKTSTIRTQFEDMAKARTAWLEGPHSYRIHPVTRQVSGVGSSEGPSDARQGRINRKAELIQRLDGLKASVATLSNTLTPDHERTLQDSVRLVHFTNITLNAATLGRGRTPAHLSPSVVQSAPQSFVSSNDSGRRIVKDQVAAERDLWLAKRRPFNLGTDAAVAFAPVVTGDDDDTDPTERVEIRPGTDNAHQVPPQDDLDQVLRPAPIDQEIDRILSPHAPTAEAIRLLAETHKPDLVVLR